MKSTNGFCPRIDRYGITSNLIGTSAVQSKHLKALSVTNAKIASRAITSAKLATNAVTNAKINNFAIGTSKLATSAVTNAKVANGTLSLGGATTATLMGKLNAYYKSAVIKTTLTVVTMPVARRPVAFTVLNNQARVTCLIVRGTTAAEWTTLSYIKLKSLSVTNATSLLMLW